MQVTNSRVEWLIDNVEPVGTNYIGATKAGYIRAFCRESGMMNEAVTNLSDKDLIQVVNVAKRCFKSGIGYDSLMQMFRRMEAAYLLSGAAGVLQSPPQAPVARYRPRPAFEPIVPAPAPAPAPAPTSQQDWVTRPEAKEIADKAAQEALGQASDNLVQEAAQAAKHATQALLDGFKASEPCVLHLTTPSQPAPQVIGLVHRKTPDIIKALSAGVNVYLHGPAGSGKTTVAQKAAQVFNLAFYFAAKVESEYMLLGFRDARGETVRTQFREAYEHGGLFLFDELDGSSPSAVVALNAALANGVCPFPDGIIPRHADFKCIAAGNTTLRGGNGAYTGRAQLDAASIDRFAFIEFGYDEALELELAANKQWARYVQEARRVVRDRSMSDDILITPRATLDGCKLFEAGFGARQVKDMTVFKGLDADVVDQIEYSMNVHFTDAQIAPQPFGDIEII
jgi:cobaltochelatase CobS